MRTPPPTLIFSFVLLNLGCFQAIDFPGQQAEIDVEPVNDVDAAAVDEAIFGEFTFQRVDQNGDGTADFSVSAVLVLGANFEAEILCEEASKANSLADLGDAFDDAIIAGSFTAKAEDVDQADGFRNGEDLDGDLQNGLAVISFFIATEGGDLVALADSAGLGSFAFDTINDDELTATFSDNLDLDFSQDDAGEAIDSDIDGLFFKAAPCDLDDIIKDILVTRLNTPT